MGIIAYRYGLRAPTQGADLVAEQMRAAHRYRNRLVELERVRRAKMRELEAGDGRLCALAEECQALDAEVLRLVEAIKEHRQQTRTRTEPPGVAAKLKEARAKLKDARKAWREERAKAEERLRPLRDASGMLPLLFTTHARPNWRTIPALSRASKTARSYASPTPAKPRRRPGHRQARGNPRHKSCR